MCYTNKPKLKTLDLLHVVAAYLPGAGTLSSFDKDLNDKKDQVKNLLGVKVVGL